MNVSKSIPDFKDFLKKDLDYICTNLSDEFSRMSGKNLLITGGAGFLGYYLVQSALHWNKSADNARRIRVTVYDNYIRGVPEWLMGLKGDKNLVLVKQDMIQPLPADIADFQYIIHAAGIASPIYYRKSPIETMDANINGLRALLEYARRQQSKGAPVEGFLFYSSSEIYGDPSPENIPTPETYRGNVSCTGPRACYDESKRYGETLCVNFAQQYGLPIKAARPFNNYGPGLKIEDGRVIPDFCRSVLAGKDIVMFSDGTPSRTFCYVTDAIVGYLKILINGKQGESYNIGVEKPEISIKELAYKMVDIGKKHLGYKGNVLFKKSEDKQYLKDNPQRRCPVITKARTHIGYNPEESLETGLLKTMQWYFDNYSK